MGFKVDVDFLRFLTMGAIATQCTKHIMEQLGLVPIELERYSCSNKIWSTKVKRLRLPDLISANTGTRVEVRAKSKMAIKMSHSPENSARYWDSSYRKEDLIAFAHAKFENGAFTFPQSVELFSVEALQLSQSKANMGPPKSASQGAERDFEWPTIVPSATGIVDSIEDGRLTIRKREGRKFTYKLRGKQSYLAVGDTFEADSCFLAGVPASKAAWPDPTTARFSPESLLTSKWEVDRYAGVKVLSRIGRANHREALHAIAKDDKDSRVRLEAACSLAQLGYQEGIDELSNAIEKPAEPYLRMEATFMLAEFRGTRMEQAAATLISAIASSHALAGDEVRQAAIWGLGSTGLSHFHQLIPFLDSDNEDERVHAIVAFGNRLLQGDMEKLVKVIADENATDMKVSGAAAVLSSQSNSSELIRLLYPLATSPRPRISSWARAILGQMPNDSLAAEIHDPNLLIALQPITLLTPQNNWTRGARIAGELNFLKLQHL